MQPPRPQSLVGPDAGRRQGTQGGYQLQDRPYSMANDELLSAPTLNSEGRASSQPPPAAGRTAGTPPGRRPASSSPRRPAAAQTPPNLPTPVSSSPPPSGIVPSSSGGPATFEEMGFHSQKLESKECIIM
jgi:hypothetical protein